MAGSSKRQKVKSKKTTKNRPPWGLSKNELTNLLELAIKSRNSVLKGVKERARNVKEKIWAIPAWIKSRPAAYKAWRKEDKKKKKYRSFRLQKRIKPEPKYIPPVGRLFMQTFKTFFKNFWVFLSIMFVHTLLYFLFVRGASSFDLEQVQETIRAILGEKSGATETFTLLGSVLGSSQQREGAGPFNVLIIIFISLAYIWALRRIYAGTLFKVRDALYQALGSFVPFISILVVMSLQSLPFTVTSYIYIIGRTNGLFISGVEDLAFFLIALFSGLLSLYWMTTSIIALYAVTLPNMYPMQTLRLTKRIVKFRRFMVFRRIIAFPVMVGLASLVVLLAVVRFEPQYSPLLVESFAVLLLPILHGYCFNLYRSIL